MFCSNGVFKSCTDHCSVRTDWHNGLGWDGSIKWLLLSLMITIVISVKMTICIFFLSLFRGRFKFLPLSLPLCGDFWMHWSPGQQSPFSPRRCAPRIVRSSSGPWGYTICPFSPVRLRVVNLPHLSESRGNTINNFLRNINTQRQKTHLKFQYYWGTIVPR